MDEKGVFTQVFEKNRGGWVCVNSQRTLLREDNPNAKKKKQSTDAELPFHIPLFSKGDKEGITGTRIAQRPYFFSAC